MFPAQKAAAGMQLHLPMLTSYDGPALVPDEVLAGLLSYRAACRWAWDNRKRSRMTKRILAEECALYPSHVTDYFALDDSPKRRDLPAKSVAAVEVACGNRCISQWLAKHSELPVLRASWPADAVSLAA